MRTALLLLFYVLVVVAGLPFFLFCRLTGQRELPLGYGLWAMRVSRRVLGLRLDVSGLEGIDPGTPRVYMPNHGSLIDGPLMLMLIPGRARVILKQSVLRIPVVGPVMRFIGFVPVDRKGARSGKRSIDRAAVLMRERGYSFLIFPEGTRTLDGRLGPFRRGGFFLALETGAPIVPVTIAGSRELMPKGRPCARPGRIEVVFHRPVPVAGYTKETMGLLMDEVRSAILTGAGR
ncbi:MAG: lysophospholipid acyltransferase family protein [Acidobacteriota bacterium]